MARVCEHVKAIRDVTPSAVGREECLKIGSPWVHLRLCRTCGHVGCCDNSPNRHARQHFHASGHPVIEGYDPPEGWGWCYVDEITFDLTDRMTRHNGPIPRYSSPRRAIELGGVSRLKNPGLAEGRSHAPPGMVGLRVQRLTASTAFAEACDVPSQRVSDVSRIPPS
jgi:hypothetical protein